MQNPGKRRRTIFETLRELTEKRITDFLSQSEAIQSYPELHTQSAEVLPEMVVTEFYEGGMDKDTTEYIPDPNFRPVKGKANFRPGKGKARVDEIHMNGFFSPENIKRVTVVGPAGSGKTVLSKRFLKAEKENLKNDEILFLINGQSFPSTDEKIDLLSFLFVENDSHSEDALRDCQKWMTDNAPLITFIVDAIDTLPFKIEDEKSVVISPDEQYSPAAIMRSLMSGELFGGSKILSTAREYAIVGYEGELQADRIIALTGLSSESIEKHTQSVLGQHGRNPEEFLHAIKYKYPDLHALCATPLFLTFTQIGYLNRKDNDPFPTTMTEIIVSLLGDLFRSPHYNDRAFKKLKLLAYNGLYNGKVCFTKKDLDSVHLPPDEASSLAVCVPATTSGKRPKSEGGSEPGGVSIPLLKGSNRFYFCHQCVQEALCAMHLACTLRFEDFESFVEQKLLEMPVVRRFLSGVLLNEDIQTQDVDCSEMQDADEKKELMLKTLTEHLTTTKDKSHRLELYIALHEAGQGAESILKGKMKSINLAGQNFSAPDMHAIGSIAKYCGELELLDFSDCYLNARKLASFYHGMTTDCTVKVKEFLLKGNSELNDSGMKKLGKIITNKCRTGLLVLDECMLETSQLSNLRQSLGVDIKFDKLSLKEHEGRPDISSELIEELCSLLSNVREQLNLHGWVLEKQHDERLTHELRALINKDPGNQAVVIHGEKGDKKCEAVRRADAFERVIERIPEAEFGRFARVKEGLALRGTFVDEAYSDHRNDSHGCKLALLRKWASVNGTNATAARLAKIVENYFAKQKEPSPDYRD